VIELLCYNWRFVNFWLEIWSRNWRFFIDVLVGSVLLIFIVFSVVLLCVFTYRVTCCDVCYDFRINTMFGSSLPPVVCRRARVLFMFFVFVCV
jgi:hypothetical protein